MNVRSGSKLGQLNVSGNRGPNRRELRVGRGEEGLEGIDVGEEGLEVVDVVKEGSNEVL